MVTKKFLCFFVVVLLFIQAFPSFLPSNSEVFASEGINSGSIYKIIAKHSGKCLDRGNSGTSNGTSVQQNTDNNTITQQWMIESVDDNYYKIIAMGSEKVLDVSAGSNENGARVLTWDYNNTDNQKWQIEPVQGDFFVITAKHSGKCLSVNDASHENGASIVQSVYENADSQKWTLQLVSTPTPAPTTPAPTTTPIPSLTPTPTPVSNVTGIIVDVSSLSLQLNQTHTLSVTALLSNNQTQTVTRNSRYVSSNTRVASVSDRGVITGLRTGSSQITVTYDNKTAYVIVNVVESTSGVPTNFQVSSTTSSSIELRWGSVANATGYDIEIDGTVVDGGNRTTYTHSRLRPDTQYTYRVRARFGTTRGNWSNSIRHYTLVDAPSNINTSSTTNQITINWNFKSGIIRYDIEFNGRVINNGTSTTYNHSNLSPNSSNRFRIRAVTSRGNGEWSSLTTVYTLLEKPTNFKESTSNNSVQLSWDAVRGATKYEVEIDNNSTFSVSDTKFTHNVSNNSKHTYRVRALNNNTHGEWSNYINSNNYQHQIIRTIDRIPSANLLNYNVDKDEKNNYEISFMKNALDTINRNSSDIIIDTEIMKMKLTLDMLLRNIPDELTISIHPTEETIRNTNIQNDVIQIGKVFEVKFISKDGNRQNTLKDINTPISIEINLSNALLSNVDNTKKLGVYYYDDTSNAWIYSGGKYNRNTRSIEFKAPYITKFVVTNYIKSFADVPHNHWARESIEILAAKNIAKGIDSTRFSPKDKVTRAQFAVFLVNALDIDISSYQGTFDDCPRNAWYTPAVEAAARRGILSGIGGGKFAPDAYVTREQMAVLLVNAYEYMTAKSTSSDVRNSFVSFNDYNSISSWAQDSVIICYSKGLIRGMPNGDYDPKGNALREQVASVLVQLLELTDKI
ncbi:UNVERIFIED_CONTAM: fibronectin type III domain protein [Acetivibrio alkalicellulosi]